MLPNDANERQTINHEFLSASKKNNLKCLEREKESESARDDSFFCCCSSRANHDPCHFSYYNALTLHVCVQFSNEEND